MKIYDKDINDKIENFIKTKDNCIYYLIKIENINK